LALFVSIWEGLKNLKANEISTLCLALIALVVSGASLFYSIYSKNSEARRSARTEFSEIIENLVDVRLKREDLLRELRAEWGKLANAATRVHLNDKRELLLSRASYILANFRINASDIQYAVIGGALSDTGRHAESVYYYKRSVSAASSEVSRAWARRVYGLSLILSGKLEQGRAELLLSAADLYKLSTEPGLDADAMRYDRADAFRRLIWAQHQKGQSEHLREDFDSLTAAALEIRNPERRAAVEESIAEIRSMLNIQGPVLRDSS
jgi:hypothetical protein